MDDRSSAGNVLIVDDTVENLTLLSSMLESEGYDVRPVATGAMALQAAKAEVPDLVLLDVNMAPMNGYEVCERLKADPATRDIPIIFVSALDDTLDKVRAFALGGIDYVTKPFQLPEVLARVRTHVALRRTQAALARSHAELRQLEAMRDDLVHMIVHDLRSPLTGVLYSFSLLRRELGPAASPKILADLDAGETATRRILGMANDLLDVSRMESAQLPMQPAQTDLCVVVREAVENVRRMQADREVVLEAGEPALGYFDAGLIRRVVENLVSNGLKHTPADQPLRIEIGHDDGAKSLRGAPPSGTPVLSVAVIDRGQGVPLEYRDRIFDKFGTVGLRRAHVYHSVGLGLPFCKFAVEAHGGRIGVDSEAGQGSAFWFVIPSAPRGAT